MGERAMEIEDIVLVITHRGERRGGVTECWSSANAPVAMHALLNTTGWIPAVNREIDKMMHPMCGKAFLMGADDMIFHEGAVQKAVAAMNEKFPDGDGVVGFNQSNLVEHCEAGFTLIGPKFLDRFMGQDFFCPEYKHYYADTEFWKYAKSVDKFYYCVGARVDHFHFSVTGQKDSTALESQKSRATDKETARKREEAGLLWGRDFTRIN